MKKKIIGILVCTLLILTAIPAVGLMNIKTDNAVSEHESASSDPEPKVCCYGSIALFNVKPGEVILDYFFVSNCGEKGSLLNWKIESYPCWGTWTFEPVEGFNLPDNDLKAILVSMVAPDVPRTEFEGEIKVVNMDNPDDYDTVDVLIETERDHSSSDPLDKPVERFPTQSKSALSDPEPKVCCLGNIELYNVKPGETVHEFFHVENIGEEGSLLDWEIESTPSWGREWEFIPESGENLEIDTPILVEVFMKAPDDPETKFEGEIKVVNMDNPNDFDTVEFIITTARDRSSSDPLDKPVERFPTQSKPASSDPEPKLCCYGSIKFFNIKPGEEIIDNFYIRNCGEEGSLLNWEIESYPSWGTWTFIPVEDFNLPYNELKMIKVYITAPDVPDTEFEGEIKVVNMDNPDDYCEVEVSICTAKAHSLSYSFLEQFPLLARLFSLPIFTRLLNPK